MAHAVGEGYVAGKTGGKHEQYSYLLHCGDSGNEWTLGTSGRGAGTGKRAEETGGGGLSSCFLLLF